MKNTGSAQEDVPARPVTAHDMPSAHNDRRRSLGLRLLLAVAIALFCAGLGLVGFLVLRFTVTDTQIGDVATQAQQRAARWPDAEQKSELAKANAYNARLAQLAALGQQPIGAGSDPFSHDSRQGSAGSGGSTGSTGGSATPSRSSSSESSSSSSLVGLDKEYGSLLDEGDGIMGTIEIPEISVKLPIFHGTSDAVLASGAGHIKGTSLPVGGRSTHAVIAAHRGLPSAMMFTRIDELRKGDPFYIRTIGRTIAYRVDRISVVGPDDTSKLKIVPGEDRVTLYTCTPYGVNTKRLLVSGVRAKIPSQVPAPSQAGPDWHKIFGGTALALALLALLAFFVWKATRRPIVMQHGPIGRHERSYRIPKTSPRRRRTHAGCGKKEPSPINPTDQTGDETGERTPQCTRSWRFWAIIPPSSGSPSSSACLPPRC